MKKIAFLPAIFLSLATASAHAAVSNFTFTNLSSELYNQDSYTVTNNGISAELRAYDKDHNQVKLRGYNLDGVGVYTGFGNARAIQRYETLSVTFSEPVSIGTLHLRQWELADRLILKSNIGDYQVLDKETSFFSSEYFSVGLQDITDITLTGDSLGTAAFLAGIYCVKSANTSEVPVPAAAWLFGSALIGLSAIRKK